MGRMKALDILMDRHLITSYDHTPQRGVSVPVVDGLVGVARLLD